MDKLPKRRKFKDNPYTLLIENGKYFIIFKDNKNILHKESVDKNIYDIFDEEEKYENARFVEYSRHYEHSELSESSLNRRMINNTVSIENIVIEDIIITNLLIIINELPKIQRDRINKYYFENKTFEEIAQEENCSKVAIKYSVDIALKKIYEKMKKLT